MLPRPFGTMTRVCLLKCLGGAFLASESYFMSMVSLVLHHDLVLPRGGSYSFAFIL